MMSLSPVLTTKLYFPPARASLVSRPRLVERLQSGLQGPITLVSAPAGYGKTTLMSEWHGGIGRDVPAAWLSLDKDDNVPARFLNYLAAALGTIQTGLGEVAVSLLQSPQPSTQTILTSLINEIMEFGKPFILALEDYHFIVAQQVHDILIYLLDHQPPQMHLVILTRADPPLPLARMRARRQLAELRAIDLRFNTEEIAAFLGQVMRLDLSAEEIMVLEQRTEGWIVGLQLAALSLQGYDHPSDIIENFGGADYYILDYLIEEVLNRQPEFIREFLLHTSILDRLCGPLCDALTGRIDGQSMLEELERVNLFISPLDSHRYWFRYHHLFGEVLRNRLRQMDSAKLLELHSRCANWHEQNGLIAEAIKYAIAGKDWDRAAQLVERNAAPMLAKGEIVLVINWLIDLKAIVPVHPWLCLYQAWVLSLTGHSEEVEPWLHKVEEYLSGIPPLEPAEIQNFEGNLAIARAHDAYMRNEALRAIHYCQESLEKLKDDDYTMRSAAFLTLGSASRLNGDLVSASLAFAEALRLGKIAKAPHVTGIALDYLAQFKILNGELHHAAELCQEAIQLATSSSGQPLPTSAEAYSRLATLHYEWNDLESASNCANTSVELSKLLARPDQIILSLSCLARIRLAGRELNRALDLLKEAEQVGVQSVLAERAGSILAALKMRVLLMQGEPAYAERLAKARGVEIEGIFNPLREAEYSMLIRVLLAQNNNQAALILQEGILRTVEDLKWTGIVIELLTLRALALHALGNMDQALGVLAQVISLAEPEGYVRTFLDEGAAMEKLLRRARSKGIMPQYVAKLLFEFAKEYKSDQMVVQTLIEPLSNRELEVLRLVAEGKSNQHIAEALIIAMGTVKKHLNNIFGKLGVQSRTQSVARARELKLL